MKLEFLSVSWKNFLSTGNTEIKIPLNKHKTTLIVGNNGAGKSTILDVLCFNLFGKAFRNINKGDLINSINNKELYTEVVLKKNKTTYRIVRGIKPNKFEIYKNDKLLNQLVDTEYQSLLEEEIGLSFKTFKQISVIGNAAYIPFMQQPAAIRRDMVEELLDIKIFTHMNKHLKEFISKNKLEINNTELKATHLNESLNLVKKLTKNNVDENKEKIKELKEKNKEIEKKISKIQEEIKKVENENKELTLQTKNKNKIEEKIKKIGEKEKELETFISIINKELDFFDKHTNCPTCHQDINSVHKEEIVVLKHEEKKKHDNNLDILEKYYLENSSKLIDINKTLDLIKKNNTLISEKTTQLRLLENSIKNNKSLIKEIENEKIKEIPDIIKIQKNIDENEKYLKDLKEEKDALDAVNLILKDDGIKGQIIKKHIPLMNKLINKYLASMDFFVNFEIDENFNETIKSRYRDKFKYSSFSEGEKMRIDLAILFSWRAVAKLRNSVNTNILFLDEVFESSLDNNGTDEFLKILNDLTDDTNTFIISHKGDQLFDRFEKVYKFEKHQSFSRLI